MELYLQFGHGMMAHSRTLISQWGGGTVILSPRDLTDIQLNSFSTQVRGIPHGRVLLDPQFYLPHSTHHKLSAHSYWPMGYATGPFFSGPQLSLLITDLITLNNQLQTSAFITPGLFANSIDATWINSQNSILSEASNHHINIPIYQTIAISSDVCRIASNIADLLDSIEKNQVYGYYIVCEHYRDDYIVEDPTWILNLLDLIAGIKVLGSRVILGYSNQQSLIASVAKVDAIASGIWMNVRAFSPSKFATPNGEELRRTTWYYCPDSLSEYTIPTLDTAYAISLLNDLASPAPVSTEVQLLFSGNQPTTVDFPEPASFRHYLNQLRRQCLDLTRPSFNETVARYNEILDDAELIINNLYPHRIRGQRRDFRNALDPNRQALSALQATRGGMLRRRWSHI